MVCYEYLTENESWLGYPYYTPEVLVSIMKPSGGQVNIVMETDSGAAISLLPSSAATLLGLNLQSGIPVELGGVGGTIFTCYVHTCDIVIGEKTMSIPIAFAPSSDFPPLLGRLGLYDQTNVFMDNTKHATCIGAVDTPLPAPNASYLTDIPLEWLLIGALIAMVIVVR